MKSVAAPFFLATSSGVDPSFSLPAPSTHAIASLSTGLVPGASAVSDSLVTPESNAFLLHQSKLAKLLGQLGNKQTPTSQARACDAISELLSSMHPSSVDVALRSLCFGVDDSAGVKLLSSMLSYFDHEIGSGQRRFELNHAHLNLLLVIHRQTFMDVPSLALQCSRIAQVSSDDGQLLTRLMDRALCIILTLLDA
jgi:hypothetical protein